MDAKTIEGAWKRSHRKWFRTALQILHDDMTAEDVIQDTLLLLLETEQPKYNNSDGIPVDMYINGFIRLRSLCYIRRTVWQRKKLAEYFSHYDIKENLVTKPVDSVTMWRADGLSLTDEEARVLERERLLKPDERLICDMYFRKSMSVARIAVKMKREYSTIKRYITSIRRVLVPQGDQHLIKNKEIFGHHKGSIKRSREIIERKKRNIRDLIEQGKDIAIKELQYQSMNAKNFREIKKKELLEEWLETQTVVRL